MNLILATYINTFGIYFTETNNYNKINDIIIKPALITKNINKINGIIMSYDMWYTLSPKLKYFSYNIIITDNPSLILKKNNYNAHFTSNIENALKYLKKNKNIEDIYMIPNGTLLNSILNNNYIKNNIALIYLYIFKSKYFYNDFYYINIKQILKNFFINFKDIYFHNDYLKLKAYNKNCDNNASI